MIKKITDAILEEVDAMMSGHFIPYHLAAFMMAILTTLFFSVTMTHSAVFEGKIAVIDLDASNYSTSLIQQLNTSAYIEITEVYHTPLPVMKLLAHDRNIGVIYIPKGLEQAVMRAEKTFNLGYFADYSNMAQNGQAIANLKSVISEIGAQSTGTRIALKMETSQEKTQALMEPISIIDRDLYNPTLSSTISICSAFIYFFSSIIFGITVLMIIGRLKVTNRWNSVLNESVIVLIARLVPYALIYTTAITLVTSAIVVFGQLRFAGNYFLHIPSIFMTALGLGMLAFIITWNTTNPSEGGSRMILIIPPGFILGGALLAAAVLPDWVNTFKYIFPLTWMFEFWRDNAYRGVEFTTMLGTYGKYILYLTVLSGILYVLHYQSKKKIQKEAYECKNIHQEGDKLSQNRM